MSSSDRFPLKPTGDCVKKNTPPNGRISAVGAIKKKTLHQREGFQLFRLKKRKRAPFGLLGQHHALAPEVAQIGSPESLELLRR